MIRGKIVVIGSGFVGATTAFTLMMSGLVSEIVIVDINRNKAEGDALDMSHGVSFVSPVSIIAGDYSDCKDADIVIITAGANQKSGESRVDLLKRNTEVFKSIVGEVTRYMSANTILLIITNPVDILTFITYKISGLPKNKVIGSGTVLDTSRLKYIISEHTNIDVRNIHTYVIGEHGDSEVATWSTTNIAGMTLTQFCSNCGKCDLAQERFKVDFEEKVKNSAYDIINKKGATYYAVALAARRIVECILRNENSILTVSGVLSGEYGIEDVALSVPTIVDSSGILRVLEVPFNENEMLQLRKSAATLRALARQAGF